LTESHGSWTNGPSGYTYQWQDCDGAGDNCAPIRPATGQSYTPTPSDVGHTVRVEETAGNAGGAGTPVSSAASSAVLPAGAPPHLIAFPSLTGGQSRGDGLTAGTGNWGPAAESYAYQWWQCTGTGQDCQSIRGQTLDTYTLTRGDEGKVIKVVVVASNQYGSTAAAVLTGGISPSPPALVGSPAIQHPPATGVLKLGTLLRATAGTWSGAGNTYSYRWQDCSERATDCRDIPGANASTYKTKSSDQNAFVRVQVTATNVDGSATAASGATRAGLTQTARSGSTLGHAHSHRPPATKRISRAHSNSHRPKRRHKSHHRAKRIS
jgi:hypothetical protein